MPTSYCSATARSGEPCQFPARRGSSLCINHDPAYATRQRRNTLKGAAASVASRQSTPIRLDAVDLSTRAGVQAVLDAVIRLELLGRIPSGRARNLIRALSLATRNFDPPSLTQRQYGYPVNHASAYRDSRAAIDRRLEAACREAEARDTARRART